MKTKAQKLIPLEDVKRFFALPPEQAGGTHAPSDEQQLIMVLDHAFLISTFYQFGLDDLPSNMLPMKMALKPDMAPEKIDKRFEKFRQLVHQIYDRIHPQPAASNIPDEENYFQTDETTGEVFLKGRKAAKVLVKLLKLFSEENPKSETVRDYRNAILSTLLWFKRVIDADVPENLETIRNQTDNPELRRT